MVKAQELRGRECDFQQFLCQVVTILGKLLIHIGFSHVVQVTASPAHLSGLSSNGLKAPTLLVGSGNLYLSSETCNICIMSVVCYVGGL